MTIKDIMDLVEKVHNLEASDIEYHLYMGDFGEDAGAEDIQKFYESTGLILIALREAQKYKEALEAILAIMPIDTCLDAKFIAAEALKDD